MKERDRVDIEVVSTECQATVMGSNMARYRLNIQRWYGDRGPLHGLALQHSWVGAIDKASAFVVVNGDGTVVDEAIGQILLESLV